MEILLSGNVDVSLLWLNEWKKVIKYICIYKLLTSISVLWIWKHVLQYLRETPQIRIYYLFYIIVTAINLPYFVFKISKMFVSFQSTKKDNFLFTCNLHQMLHYVVIELVWNVIIFLKSFFDKNKYN